MSLDIATVTGVIIIAIIITGAVGNCLTLFVFYRYDPLRDVTGLFLANLAVADLLQSVIGMPLIATSAFYEEWVFGEILCTISGATNSLFCITSVLTLTAVSVDRYLAIVHPLEYPTWLSMKRSKMVVVCLWLMAFFAALLPVLGWSRYVYLPYEFICTVQWEHDKAYTIFVWSLCFVGPLIITVACYSSVMKVARQQAREKPLTTVGRLSKAGNDPDVGGMVVADGKGEAVVEENLAFTENDDKNSDAILLEESVTCHMEDERPEDDIHRSPDPHPGSGMEVQPATSVGCSGLFLDFRRNHAVAPVVPLPLTEKARSDTFGISRTQLDPTIIVLTSNPEEESTCKRKDGTSPWHTARARFGPSGKLGLSRVSPVSGDLPVMNSWTKEMSQKNKLTIIQEEDKEMDYPTRATKLPGYLARVRERMAERKIGDRQSRRKEMKVVLILLIVNGTFVLCWLPHLVGAFCLTFTGGFCPFPDNFFIITTTLAMLNSGCNPFIYTLTYRKFRRAFKRVLPCFPGNNTGGRGGISQG